jgi:cell division protein FtsL
MNDFQTPTQSNSDLSEQVAALRSQLFMLLLALIVVSATVTGYLYLQARHASRDIAQATQVIEAINKNRANIHGFVEQLAAYGQKNPAFQQQVLKKYGITPQTVGAPKQ